MRSDEDMIRGLKTFKLFSRLPDEDLACLADVMEEKNFPAGTVILREGDSGALASAGQGTYPQYQRTGLYQRGTLLGWDET